MSTRLALTLLCTLTVSGCARSVGNSNSTPPAAWLSQGANSGAGGGGGGGGY